MIQKEECVRSVANSMDVVLFFDRRNGVPEKCCSLYGRCNVLVLEVGYLKRVTDVMVVPKSLVCRLENEAT